MKRSCVKCSYEWEPKSLQEDLDPCPNCEATLQEEIAIADKEAQTQFVLPKLECKRCEHSWTPRHDVVKMCPKCKSRLWNKPKVTTNER